MNTLTITIPIPDKGLSPNARLHWARKRKLTANSRLVAAMHARAALGSRKPPHWEQVKVSIVIFWPTKARHDRDNARGRLKAAMDGFTDAGVWSDDGGIVSDELRFDYSKTNPRVEVTVTPNP